jgi:hypothetical protein
MASLRSSAFGSCVQGRPDRPTVAAHRAADASVAPAARSASARSNAVGPVLSRLYSRGGSLVDWATWLHPKDAHGLPAPAPQSILS